jgi:MFS family permease
MFESVDRVWKLINFKVSFIIASRAECDLTPGLDDYRKVSPAYSLCTHALCSLLTSQGWITSSVFIGMMFGGWIWGSMADKHGRRPTLMFAMLTNALFGGLCCIATTYDQFLALRIISGLGCVQCPDDIYIVCGMMIAR